MAEYCPHISTCPFYQNWAEQTNPKRVDVIIGEKRGTDVHYDCIALIALNDSETGKILISATLKSKLSNPNQRKFDCSNITLLNKLES